MTHTFWRGEYIVIQRSDGSADIYEWQPAQIAGQEPGWPASGFYKWLGDYGSTDEAERYVREMEALPEFPEIKPINSAVHPLPKLQSIFDRAWTKQQARKAS